MNDTFLITVVFIIACTFVGAFIKGRSRDRCLKDIDGYPVTLRMKDSQLIWGRARVENGCMELAYDKPHENERHAETSYILYKGEYDNILMVIRYTDNLNAAESASRSGDLERTKNPSRLSRMLRSVRNIFGTIRDSLMELTGLLIGQMQSMTPAGKVLKGQDKYVAQMQQEGISAMSTAYEPVLERYMGKRVVLAVSAPAGKEEYSGVLKEYTAKFVEILDTEYRDPDGKYKRADIVVLRSGGIVRHAGEREGA